MGWGCMLVASSAGIRSHFVVICAMKLSSLATGTNRIGLVTPAFGSAAADASLSIHAGEEEKDVVGDSRW